MSPPRENGESGVPRGSDGGGSVSAKARAAKRLRQQEGREVQASLYGEIGERKEEHFGCMHF